VRRLVTIVAAAAVIGAAIALIGGSVGHGQPTARFDVIFDDARGLVAGQLVKIAGARAGTINDVVLTSGFKARIEASVDRRFMPFHRNSTCTIRPEGLIAENYLECDPGTAGSQVLRASGDQPPTVPVTRTTEPVSLLDLFNTFNLPTRERGAVILDELGIATAGRGQDINQILQRANPALGAARDAISVLVSQRTQLQSLIDSSDKLATTGAAGTAQLRRFLDRAAGLSTLTATHGGALSQSIARLPALLAATRPALAQLDSIATQGTPLLQQLRAAAPSLNRVSDDLGPFATVAKPALSRLSSALGKAIPAIRQSTPLIQSLRAYASRSKSSTALAGRLFTNLQQHGFTEEFMSIFYYVGAALSRFDSTSHLLPLYVIAPQNGACGLYSTKPVPGCSAHYGAQAGYQAESAKPARERAAARRSASRGGPSPGQPSATPSAPTASGSPSAPNQPSTPVGPLPSLPSLPSLPTGPPPQPTSVLQAIAKYLLK
jgi:phospholipid/cholesterol/gamma-HCH transport system substrate-binding protein